MMWARVLSLASLAIGFATGASADYWKHVPQPPTSPYARIALDASGDAIAEGAIASRNPYLFAVGYSYKAVILAHDIGDAAVDRKNAWLDTQIITARLESTTLKNLIDNGDDPEGSAATALKNSLRARVESIQADNNAPLGYTATVIVRNYHYGIIKVGLDKAFEWSLGKFVDWIGLSTLVD